MALASLTLGCLVALGAHATSEGNMNGLYPYSPTPKGRVDLLPKEYRDYPGEVEYYDWYSPPMETLYSQVWWKPLAPTELPAAMVAKYNGTKAAIVGWEMDQVRVTPRGDVSVPISASYNHHFTSVIAGAGATFEKIKFDGPRDPRAAEYGLVERSHGRVNWDEPQYVVAGGEAHPFSSGNGGEYRKTQHGFAPGYALVVDSPRSVQVTPMQIDTWNRDEMDIDGPLPPPFVAGPEPRASLAPPGAGHSGLLECPMTTRLGKRVDGAYALVESCASPIVTYHECFEAAAAVTENATLRNVTGDDAARPPACSVAGGAAFFNECAASTARGAVVCPTDPKPFGQATGALVYHATAQKEDVGSGAADSFGGGGKSCAPWPATTLLDQANPSCDVRTYRGGQWACHHMWSLLDADQDIPWADEPLVFRQKIRWWVQPYDASVHTPVRLGEGDGSVLLLGSPWEYDIPKCGLGVPGCSLHADGATWLHTVRGNSIGKETYVTANSHCHAPTCLSTAVYACPEGTPLEACDDRVGELVCENVPVYGGSGAPSLAGTRFDEPGYIAIADCMWGSADYGLEAPRNLTGVPLHVVKVANATHAHYGEMSGTQPWVM